MRDSSELDQYGIGAVAIYALVSLLVFGRGLIGDFSGRMVSSAAHDSSVEIWSLVWWPHALTTHIDPFLCRVVWAPTVTSNLAWVASLPAAALLAWPLTSWLGPIPTFNLLCLLSLAAACYAAFLLCRYLTKQYWPSLMGGFIFGMSPYMLAHLTNHLFLVLIFPIPLAVLLTVRLLDGNIRARIFTPLMAILIVLQFGFSLELFATMTLVGVAALVLGFVVGPEPWRRAIGDSVIPIASSYAIAALFLTPYWYYILAFGTPKGPIISAAGVSSDLLNVIVPTDVNLLGAVPIFKAASTHFTFRTEADAYVPWPLLVVVPLYVRARWRTPLGKTLTLMLVAMFIATLGPRLHVGGHVLFGLPWKVVEHLPLLKSALPARFMMYAFLIIAVMTATFIASSQWPRSIRLGLSALILIFMLPDLHASSWVTPVQMPKFFADGAYRNYLQKDKVVMILPFGNRGNSMLWQAATGMYFRLAGGYVGVPIIADEFARWPIVNALYWGSELPDAQAQLGPFLATHDVHDIIVEQSRMAEFPAMVPMLSALNITPIKTGDILVYRIPDDLVAKYRNADPIPLEQRYNHYRFDRELIAAEKYLSSGADLAQLCPSHAVAMGLLPSSWAVDHDTHTKDGLIMGPSDNGRVMVGLVGSYEALRPLISDYSTDAAQVYFPYPHPLNGPPKGNTFMRKLVMVFGRDGLERAAHRASTLGETPTPQIQQPRP
ncbi:MAG TPA: hypothetical protein VN867_14880 [Candidatus Binataceae bacterium]|nr:hypothetical protein [Candidatus Binataceae bacterium]